MSENKENKLSVIKDNSSLTGQNVSLTLPPKTDDQVKPRKVVGLFWQIVFLTNKNFILARRNIVGTLGEILVALLFVLILLIMRYVYDVSRYSDQANLSAGMQSTNANPINKVVYNINLTNQFTPIIYYYPNNAYVVTLVTAAYNIIVAQQPLFSATRKFKLN